MDWIEPKSEPVIQVCVFSLGTDGEHIFISAMHMGCSWSVAEEMEKVFEAGDYDEDFFKQGDGEYMLKCMHEEPQIGEYGRVEIAGGWYFEVMDCREFDWPQEEEEAPLFESQDDDAFDFDNPDDLPF